ncbi:MAG: hypothetical protein PW788_05960 [Micavibrio sp.]|nr:hypothetical protein [Micavibrio sp.]
MFSAKQTRGMRCTLIAIGTLFTFGVRAQDLPQEPAASWVKSAAERELHIIDDDGTFPVRYRMRRIDNKRDVTREIIESRDGSVARTVLLNGKPLSAEDDAAERNRLQAILDDPADFLKSRKRNSTARSYAMNLVRLMPQAMLYTYVPGQPQPPNATGPQIVLDFKPDPKFHPPTTISELLTGLQGRMWIDKRSGVLTRIEGQVIKPVNFGWGVLAHIYPGGTVDFEQAPAGNGRWVYSHLEEHIVIREVLVHTAHEDNRIMAADIHLLAAPLSYREAIRQLLEMPLPR